MGVRLVAVTLFGVWAFYGIATWGWVLVRGYNIRLADWFNPLKPFIWDGDPPMVPAGHVFPVADAGAGTAAAVQAA